jgi:ribosomal protein S18 acetylase RimI-like enzyme
MSEQNSTNESTGSDGDVAPFPSGAVSVRPGERRDIAGLSELLARSFAQDPQLSWLLDGRTGRERRLAKFFSIYLYDAVTSGALDVATSTSTNTLLGAAAWMPPGKRFASLGRQLICIPSFVAIFGRRLGAASELARLLSKVHPVEPHWYLAVLGVDDSCQGRGVGASLVRHGLRRADEGGYAAYLETNKESNVLIYEHLGFARARVVDYSSGCPSTTTMWRASVTKGSERDGGTGQGPSTLER